MKAKTTTTKLKISTLFRQKKKKNKNEHAAVTVIHRSGWNKLRSFPLSITDNIHQWFFIFDYIFITCHKRGVQHVIMLQCCSRLQCWRPMFADYLWQHHNTLQKIVIFTKQPQKNFYQKRMRTEKCL